MEIHQNTDANYLSDEYNSDITLSYNLQSDRSLSTTLIIGVSVAIGAAVIIAILIVCLYRRCRRGNRMPRVSNNRQLQHTYLTAE